ncbi:unnamed protein product [Durusdinium trenchii]|uniref:Uncharacterized protein n=1 Tax=Durusdinium trenchii TaxID=1381693 RepID=A0ABP0P8M2_9DINO
MGHYGGGTPKRHYCWSSSRHVKSLDKGKFQWKKFKEEHPNRVETVRRYRDKNNKVRYQGVKNTLRATEIYPIKFARAVVDLHARLISEPVGPAPPPVVPPALQSFLTFPEDSPEQWPHARLGDVFKYLRKLKGLRVPREWEPHIPDAI